MKLIVDGQVVPDLRLLHVGKHMVIAENDTSEFLIQKSRISLIEFSKEDSDGLSFDDVYRDFEPAGKPIAGRLSPEMRKAAVVARDVYAKWGCKIPSKDEIPLINKFLKIAKTSENLEHDLDELGKKGHLTKGVAYVMAALRGMANNRGVQRSDSFTDSQQDDDMNMDAGKSVVPMGDYDRVILPNGDVWSSSLGRRVTPEELATMFHGKA